MLARLWEKFLPAPIGRRGERIAARWLERRGYRILARNLRSGRNEADLVALDPDRETIVIVEVKTRTSPRFEAELSVNREKRAHLTQLALHLQRQSGFEERPFRFDVVVVELGDGRVREIRHHPGAFDAQ